MSINNPRNASSGVSPQQLLADLARETLIERRRSRRWSIFFKLLTFAYITGALLWVVIDHKELFTSDNAQQHTAVIDIEGVIADGQPASADPIVSALKSALKNKSTAGVILRINSPGGSPVQSGLLFDSIQSLRAEHPDVPVHAVLGDVAASGGYYIAVAADNIYANQASIVGSIGVRLDSFGATGAIEKLGIERRLLTAGEYKAFLDPFLPVDPAAEAHVQALLDNVHTQFIQAVKEGRGDRLNDDEQLFSGLIWSGEQAVANGLIDALADSRTVARDVIGAEDLVDYTRRPDVFTRFADRLGASLGVTLHRMLQGGMS